MITVKDISCLTVAGWRETREPASMGCNKVHSDLFYSARQHGTSLARTNTVKKQEENLGEMKVNGPGRSKLGQGRNPCSGRSMHGYILTYSRL